MHIPHVSIENIRRFGAGDAKVELDLPPRGWIVIAGPNGAGKTTFLQVLALALSSFSQDFTDTLFRWTRKGATSARSRVTLVPSDEDVLRPDVEVRSSKAAGDDLLVGDYWSPSDGATSHERESESNRAFAGPWHREPKGWFAVGYGPHRRIVGSASSTEPWLSATTREGAFLTLFRDDASLVHTIRWLMDLEHRSLDPHAKRAVQDEARSIVDAAIALLNDGLLGEMKVSGVDSYGLHVRVGGQVFSVLNLGEGAQVLVATVIDILRQMHARFPTLRVKHEGKKCVVEHGGVVLIDEVDAHLHVAWQQQLGPWLIRHFPNVQFIVTTHSPFICQAATEGGLVLLPALGTSETVRIADEQLYRRVVNGSVDTALLSDLFGLEHTWSGDAETKRERLAHLEARVLTGRAKPLERREYKRLLAEVPQTMSDEVDRAVAKLAAPRATTVRR